MAAPDRQRRLPLFAYGTLTSETFVGQLLERPVRSEPAQLPGFELLELPALGFPTVFATEEGGQAVTGRLYRELSPEDLERLDAYEGVAEGLYVRITAEVVPEAGGTQEAFLYVVTEKALRRHLTLEGSP